MTIQTYRSSPRSKGFTLIELMVVILILGILATIGQAGYMRAIDRAEAIKIMEETQVVATATTAYLAQYGTWPEDRNPGIIPPGLREHLPPDFSFRGENYNLDYEYWPWHRTTTVGVTIRSSDKNLISRIEGITRNAHWEGTSTQRRLIVRHK